MEKRKFGTTVKDLEDLGRWLTRLEVTDVVMESAGASGQCAACEESAGP